MTAGSASASSSNLGGEIHRVTDNTWSESATTYSNRPAYETPGARQRRRRRAERARRLRPDLGDHRRRHLQLRAHHDLADDVIYQTREASAGKPQLIISLKQNTAPVVRITAPAAGTIFNIGQAITFQGTATDAESGNMSSNIQWSSSLDGAFGSGAARTISTLRAGVHTITARVTDAQGLTGQGRRASRSAHAAGRDHGAGAQLGLLPRQRPITLTGTATDFEDGDMARNIRWSSSKDGALGTGASIPASALTLGTHVLTAAVTDSDGQVGQASVTIRMRDENQAPQLVISTPTNGTSKPAGTRIVLTASATDDFDGDLSSRISWTSSRDGTLGTGASRDVLLSEGGHTITASVTDSDGALTTASISIAITPTRTGRQHHCADRRLDAARQHRDHLHRRCHRCDRRQLVGQLELGVVARRRHRPRPDLHHLEPRHGGARRDRLGPGLGRSPRLAQVSFTVIRMPVVTILLPQQNDGFLAGANVTFFGTADDLLDGDLSAGLVWTDSVAGQIGTGQTFTVTNLAQGTHTVTARAVNTDSRAGTASVTINVNQGTITFEPVADVFVDSSLRPRSSAPIRPCRPTRRRSSRPSSASTLRASAPSAYGRPSSS
jgi:hypothetical protein